MIPGKTVDLRWVKRFIVQKTKEFNIENICYDPWRSTQLAKELIEHRVPMMEMSQNYKNFTEVISDLQVEAIEGRFKHGGHPVLRWNNENTTIKLGSNQTMMFDKSQTKTRGAKIDGMVALAMAQFGRTNNISNRYTGQGPRT
jgi:phage terminase large subunit-like protein